MSWLVTAGRPDGLPGCGYLASDLHPQEGQRLILTGIPALAYVFETREKAEGFASVANFPDTKVTEGVPEGDLDCPAMIVAPPRGN